MCVCLYVYMCVCLYVYMCVCLYVYMYELYMCVCVYIYVCAGMCVYACVCIYMCVCIYIYIGMCVYMCMCVYVCIDIYPHTEFLLDLLYSISWLFILLCFTIIQFVDAKQQVEIFILNWHKRSFCPSVRTHLHICIKWIWIPSPTKQCMQVYSIPAYTLSVLSSIKQQ